MKCFEIANRFATTGVFAAFAFLASASFVACGSNDVAGTDEQANSIADNPSSSSIEDNQSSSSEVSDDPTVTPGSEPSINPADKDPSSSIIIPNPDSTVYIHNDETTTQENLNATKEKIFGNDTLVAHSGSRDTIRIYFNKIQTDSIGPLFYRVDEQYDKTLFCNRGFYDNGKEYTFKDYATAMANGITTKYIKSSDASIIEEFKSDCEKENGIYEIKPRISCEYQDCEFDNASCKIDTEEGFYTDPTWEKYSAMMIDMCSGPTLDSIRNRNIPEVQSGHVLKSYESDPDNSSSETLFGTNRISYSFQQHSQYVTCHDENDEILLAYDISLILRADPVVVHKTLMSADSKTIQEFISDCEEEGGWYDSDILPTCTVQPEIVESATDSVNYKYTDSNWEKYAQKVISRCEN